jgi:hypothetical protein
MRSGHEHAGLHARCGLSYLLVVTAASRATLHGDSSATPIRTPLQFASASATITELTVSIPGDYNNSLAVDDLTFTGGRGPLAACS